MDHPKIRIDLDGVERAEGITSISQGDLEHATMDALERLRLLRLPALSGDSKRVKYVGLHVFREILEVPAPP